MNFYDFVDNVDNLSLTDLLDQIQTDLEEDERTLDLQFSQWDMGEDAKGRVLGYYSYMTEILSNGRKLQGDRYNLLDTGSFRKETFLFGFQKGKDLEFNFDSTDSKTSILLDEIGEDLFGLQPKNKEKFTTIAVEKAIKNLNEQLKIK